jgi:hypothetical protein
VKPKSEVDDGIKVVIVESEKDVKVVASCVIVDTGTEVVKVVS